MSIKIRFKTVADSSVVVSVVANPSAPIADDDSV